ncbi:mediator of RNA polymerase II transcription subunit 6-like [Hibiscus syriacus]|uniref:mediator of RNA polymerase II transcription subunit 6-like n=1 Tax=Hibiscus syriacus TaxID=106335 RepID=UPI001923F81E|nr:mediator of RNA polymerase II transcription subunit 6-like [Hibiscus syriacus]
MATPLVPPSQAAAGGDFEAPPPPPMQPPGTDMTGICFRDQLWLNTYPLDRNLVFDYFALSPFYDWTCNNEHLRMRSIHPLDISQLSYTENESETLEPKGGKEAIDFKEVKRVDHILASLQRKVTNVL